MIGKTIILIILGKQVAFYERVNAFFLLFFAEGGLPAFFLGEFGGLLAFFLSVDAILVGDMFPFVSF